MLLSSEDEARAWFGDGLSVSRETLAQLDHYVALLREANATQNLIAASTATDAIWVRHIADSAQLLPYALECEGEWLDLGSGPGLPGLVVALCDPERAVTLVESRRLRCEFLRHCCRELGLSDRVTVIEAPLSRMSEGRFAVISARAFAPLLRLLADASRFADTRTRWLLPKGRGAQNELSSISPAWQRLFHVEPSLTDANAAILVGTGVPAVKSGGKTGKKR
jgi:16S rRNA (guanine527-N7)-methyltransferase